MKTFSNFVFVENGSERDLNETDIESFEYAYRELGSKGERVIAFADMELPRFASDHKFDLSDGDGINLNNLRFIGLISMIDPPR